MMEDDKVEKARDLLAILMDMKLSPTEWQLAVRSSIVLNVERALRRAVKANEKASDTKTMTDEKKELLEKELLEFQKGMDSAFGQGEN